MNRLKSSPGTNHFLLTVNSFNQIIRLWHLNQEIQFRSSESEAVLDQLSVLEAGTLIDKQDVLCF